MSKMQSFREMTKTFLWLVGEEWNEMDRKLLRIATGAIAFILSALFWYFFLSKITPF
ncbi:MAG: hypothetical protein V1900_02820 [Candidatus Aenigmatarchaeota archaeon]